MIAFTLVLLAVLPAGASEPGWTGRWDTRWRDGGAHMELTQQGNRITGSYPAYGGQIEGEVTGREVAVDQAGARQALRTFVLAGNAARDGNPDEWAKAASIATGQKLATDERADKTALMLGVPRLADRMRVRLGDLDYATPELGAAAE